MKVMAAFASDFFTIARLQRFTFASAPQSLEGRAILPDGESLD
jgi:hypothetical protein